MWNDDFKEVQTPADLRGAFFDLASNLSGSDFGDVKHGFPRLADVRWGGVNLAVVDWETAVGRLGDERDLHDVEDYYAAIRANRQLAVALKEQGVNELVDRFSFRAQELQQKALWMQGIVGRFFMLFFSRVLAGYGYRPLWTFYWYCAVVCVATLLYYFLGVLLDSPMSLSQAFIGSVTAFHGRGLFEYSQLTVWQGAVAAIEAVFGLVIEVCFIVTFTQRFFGK